MVYNMRRASCYLALTLLAFSLLHRGVHSLRPFTETSSAATISNRPGNSHVQVIVASDGNLTVTPGAAGQHKTLAGLRWRCRVAPHVTCDLSCLRAQAQVAWHQRASRPRQHVPATLQKCA